MDLRATHLSPAAFPPTHWSVILKAAEGGSGEGAAALEEMCRAYWYPLYAYCRRDGCSAEDAQDLTQAFFEHLLQTRLLAGVDSTKGRFRSFLLQCFRNHVASDRARARTQKRGGGRGLLSLDVGEAEQRFARELSRAGEPELAYDRDWALAVLDEALNRLRQHFEQTGRGRVFEVLRPFLSGEPVDRSYASVAAELGATVGSIRVMVHRLRQRYRAALRGVVTATVADPGSTDEELRYLLKTVRE